MAEKEETGADECFLRKKEQSFLAEGKFLRDV